MSDGTENHARRRLLLVEDDRVLRDTAASLLESHFPELGVLTAHDLVAAQLVQESEAPDIIVADRNLGVDDGLPWLVRAKRARPGLVVILLTGGRLPPQDAGGEGLHHVDHVLLKPFEAKELVDLVRIELGRASARAAAKRPVRRLASTPRIPAARLQEPGLDAQARHSIVSKLNAALLCARAVERAVRAGGDSERALANIEMLARIIHEVSSQLGHTAPDGRSQVAGRR